MSEGIILTRPEQAAFYETISQIHRAAFQSEDEPRIVEKIRQDPDFNPKFSIMALLDGQVVGHVLLSPLGLAGAESLKLLALGPIGVLPDYQGQFIGSALVYEAIEVARRAKADALFLLGNPAYYTRFGFSLEHPFTNKFDPDHLLMLELNTDALAGLGGQVVFHPAFG